MTYIDLTTTPTDLQIYLSKKKWLLAEEDVIHIEKPGEGNMNVVLRVKTNQRSFILKQSRPFVQKYQQLEAPIARIVTEYSFYSTITNTTFATYFPKILAFDETEYLLMQEDLGQCEDMSYLYNNSSFEVEQMITLTQILQNIHQTKPTFDYPENNALKLLNHQHIFILPFLEQNGFELDDIQLGLQRVANPFKKDSNLKAVIASIGNKYLQTGNVLLHGDYYPGSWMIAQQQLFVIDPEFSFMGFAEFDIGVMIAHSIMITMEENISTTIFNAYTASLNHKLTLQIAGIEIMRRIIGLAQLPLTRTLEEKTYLLQIAKKMIL